MKRNILSLSLLASLTLLALYPVQAQVTAAPAKMNFQGRLAKPDGTPVPDGTYTIRFSLWDALANGTEQWNQTINTITVHNGTFATLLDVSTANLFNGNLWLEIKIGTDAPLTPRQPLVSVPFALKANTVPDGSITANKLASDALNNLSWLLGGNSGTTPAGQFMGTTDNQPLAFRTNNSEQMRLDTAGNLGLGTSNPAAKLDVRGAGIVNIFAGDLAPYGFAGFLTNFSVPTTHVWLAENSNRVFSVTGGGDTFVGGSASIQGNITSHGTDFRLNGRGGGAGNNGGEGRALVDNGTDSGLILNFANDFGQVTVGSGMTVSGNTTINGSATLNGPARINGSNTLEFGAGVSGKQIDAGKIGYQTYTSNALDIIGAGTTNSNRRITFWNEGGANFTGGIFIGAPTITNTSAIQALSSSSVTTVFVSNSANGVGGFFQANDANALNAQNNSSAATITVQNNGSGPAGTFTTGGNSAVVANSNSGLPTISAHNSGSGEAGYFQAGNNTAVHAINNSNVPTLLAVNSGSGNCASLLGSDNTALNAVNNSSSTTIAVINQGSGQAGFFQAKTGTALFVTNASPTFPALLVQGGGNNYTAQFLGKIVAQGYDTNSDARFKTHITTFENALDDVLNLRGVTYDWDRAKWPSRNFSDRRQIGFIAQEVEKVLPELVSTDGDGYKSVAYASVVPVLVEAVKTQQKQLNDKQKQIDELKALNATWGKEIDALKKQNDRIAELEKQLADILNALKQGQTTPDAAHK